MQYKKKEDFLKHKHYVRRIKERQIYAINTVECSIHRNISWQTLLYFVQ